MANEKQRLVKFVNEMNFDELEEWQMFTMVDWKLAIINPTEEDWRDYYLEQQAERQLEEYLLSKNEEDKFKAINKFFKEEEEIYNMFLGENGVQKLLNGKKFGWTTLMEIDEIIIKQILPYFDKQEKAIEDKIMNKYKLENKEVI